MGIVNATPDSFSDARRAADVEARVARGARLVAAGAAIVDVGGESRCGAPPGRRGRGGDRARGAADRARSRPSSTWSSRSTRYKPAVAAAAIAAGARSSTTSPACATRRWPTCARATGAGAGGHAHARRRRRGSCSTRAATTTSSATSPASCASGWRWRVAAGVAPEQMMLDPGPDFAKTPAQTVAVLRRLDALRALGRPCCCAVSRKDFLGAITGRGRRATGAPATLAALGWASTRARTSCACTTSRGRRLPARARRPARRARARAGRGPHARPLPAR